MSEYDFSPEAQPRDKPAAATADRQMDERVHLVRKLSDVMALPQTRLSGNERALISDILLQVIDRVDVALRVEVAARLAKVPDSPPALLHRLLLDEPEVAEKILQNTDQISEAFLIDAARQGTSQHRLMIAKRRDISTALADAVLSHNEIEICKTLLRREDCSLSPNALNTLVALSATISDLRGPLLRRRELEPSHGLLMFWWVNGERRRRIIARFSLDRRVIQEALSDLYSQIFLGDEPDPFVKDVLTLADRRFKPRNDEGETLTRDAVLAHLHRAYQSPDAEQIDRIAVTAHISPDLARRIMHDAGGEPFAVLCKAMGVPRDDYFGILKDGEDVSELHNQSSDYLLGVFDMLARDFAHAILRYWNWDNNPRTVFIKQMLGVSDLAALSARV